MLWRKSRIITMILCTLALYCSGCGNNTSNSSSPSNKLVMYWGADEDFMIKYKEAFTNETGIEVEAVRMSSGEILGRIKAEKNNPKASVWFGGSIDGHIQAKKDGLLIPYISPNTKEISEKYKDAQGYWTGVYIGYLGFASNKKLLVEKHVSAPNSWQDLLKPEFEQQIVCANPGSSGTSYAILATIVQLMGEKNGLAYMKKLDKQIKFYPKSGTAAARLAGQGECMVGLTYLHDAIKFKEQGAKDLILTVPKEGTGYEIGGVSLIKGGPDKVNAQKFIDWCLTKEAQNLNKQAGAYQFLTNKHATAPAIAEKIAGTKLINYDFIWAGENRRKFVNSWSVAIGEK